MKTKFQILTITAMLLTSITVFAQNPKTFFKAGKDYLEQKNYSEAISNFTKAIDLKPDYTDAFNSRAIAYENAGKLAEATQDYIRLTSLTPKDESPFKQAARLYNLQKNYDEALKIIDKALEISKKDVQAYQIKTESYLAKEQLDKALATIETALRIRESGFSYYLHGIIIEQMKNFSGAETDLKTSIAMDPKSEASHVALARVLLAQNKYDESMEFCNKAISMNNKSKQAYSVRSLVYRAKLDYSNAINDLSQITVLSPDDMNPYLLRGTYYMEFNQINNAIVDFSKVINTTPNNYQAFSKRAAAYEQISDFKSAIKDYQTLAKFTGESPELKEILEKAKARLYELNRENVAPTISIKKPIQRNSSEIEIQGTASILDIEINIKDENNIEYLKINDITQFKATDTVKTYRASVNVDGIEYITISTSDIYKNITSNKYTIVRTEVNPPEIKITSPFAAENGELYLESLEPNLYVEGNIKDASKIKSIHINGATASYMPDNLNPTFSANINVNNVDKITVKATDIYDNVTINEYKLNREQAGLIASNPMGKTWVIFIQNSNYKSFASLNGPSKDVTTMKSALAQYDIHNTIVKNDMTKEQLDKFFSIELRDLVRANKVNSLMVWYAGHGKFVNQTGYWIPVDANRDDEYSYFNINQLKASIQSYSNNVAHVLVISDACESGPSFYQAMRNDPKERSCNDVSATRFKSSQVFTSAGYELALDNSQFTKTFANTLAYNSNQCIPIESVVVKVTNAVKNTKQRPQFGKIQGLEDEDGTFFFMKKK